MRRFAYETVDVFTDRRFGGNPVAVFTDANGLSDSDGGTWEDPATGSANAALAAYLLSLTSETELKVEISQGVAMGRPSRLLANARRNSDGIHAAVGGACVSVFFGTAQLD